jgi:hypothetical protein
MWVMQDHLAGSDHLERGYAHRESGREEVCDLRQRERGRTFQDLEDLGIGGLAAVRDGAAV